MGGKKTYGQGCEALLMSETEEQKVAEKQGKNIIIFG